MFTATAHKPEHSVFAEKLRVSLNRLASEDPSFVEQIRQGYRELVWRDVFGDSPLAPPVPQEEA